MSRRIAAVRRVRDIQERLARAEVARRRSEQARLDAARAELRALVDDRAGRTPSTTPRIAAHAEMIDGGICDVAGATTAVSDAVDDVDRAMLTWTEAARRQEGIERLAGRFAEEDRRQDDRRERIELDDLVIGRWGRS